MRLHDGWRSSIQRGHLADAIAAQRGPDEGRIWNRMSSRSYFPPPVKAVEIPKPGGAGVRVLGVPTIADRVAQTVARMYLEPTVEPIFHPDSYGYRPGRSALDAVGMCRERCWRTDWVVDQYTKACWMHRHTAPFADCHDQNRSSWVGGVGYAGLFCVRCGCGRLGARRV